MKNEPSEVLLYDDDHIYAKLLYQTSDDHAAELPSPTSISIVAALMLGAAIYDSMRFILAEMIEIDLDGPISGIPAPAMRRRFDSGDVCMGIYRQGRSSYIRQDPDRRGKEEPCDARYVPPRHRSTSRQFQR